MIRKKLRSVHFGIVTNIWECYWIGIRRVKDELILIEVSIEVMINKYLTFLLSYRQIYNLNKLERINWSILQRCENIKEFVITFRNLLTNKHKPNSFYNFLKILKITSVYNLWMITSLFSTLNSPFITVRL